MWKCASGTLRATLCRSILKYNTVLSTKAPQEKEFNCLLKLAPVLLERFNRYYGFYKTSCENFSNEKKDKEGPKKRNSFLGDIDSNVFDALGWSGVFVLGYYFLQPFTRKRLSSNFSSYDNHTFPTLSGYQQTIQYLIYACGIKPFNYVVPEVKAAKSKTSQKQFPEPIKKSEEENLIRLEKAHQKVLGTLRNWIGTQYMHSGKHKEALEYFMQAAEEENAAGIFNLGICYERGLGTSQNFERAAELYQKAADLGHATAMYNLGVFYVQGLGGVEPDVDHARELFNAAASLGQIDAKKALFLEKQPIGELSENIQISKETENKNSSLSHLMCNEFLSQSSNSKENCNNCDARVKNINYNSYDYAEGNSAFDSDSGVLDLSPHNESEVLMV